MAIIPLWWYNRTNYIYNFMEAAMTMRDMTCCFTGHRNIPQGEIPILEEKLETLIRALVEEKIVYYG